MTIELQEKVLLYFAGKLNKELVIEMFAELVKTEAIWHMPTSFLDTAGTLWEAGYIGPPKSLRGMDT